MAPHATSTLCMPMLLAPLLCQISQPTKIHIGNKCDSDPLDSSMLLATLLFHQVAPATNDSSAIAAVAVTIVALLSWMMLSNQLSPELSRLLTGLPVLLMPIGLVLLAELF